ncbi:MAG: MFS transporter [Bacillota bacterium]|nr:MFS transporter [Bacillota bacterium]
MHKSKSEQYKRNYVLLVLEGSFFMGGIGFFSSSTVIPVFIDMITHSKELVGLTITLGSFLTYFGRLLVGPYMPHVKNHARFVTIIMFFCRPMTILPAFFIFTGHYSGAVFVLIFSYAVVWLADGLVVPGWSEVLANTVDENRHGRLLGMQMLIGGMASIGAGVLINVFLGNPRLDIKTAFAWIFLIGGLLLVLSCFMMALTENAPTEYRIGKVDIKGYYKSLPQYFRIENDNTRMMIVQLIIMTASMSVPFVILFAREKLGLPDNMTAVLILIQTLGVPLGGWLWGQICDRFGCTTGIRLAAANILLIAVLPLLALVLNGIAPMIMMVPAMFLAGVSGGIWTCNYIYTVQVVRPESRSACLVLSSIVTLPITFSSYLAGFISERFGFVSLFIACIGIAIIAFIVSFRIRPVKTVIEERKREAPGIS